jgi:excisionase family DNA binding protein
VVSVIDISTLPAVLRPDEVAAVLRCSVKTIYRLSEAGKLEAVKLGSRIRITRRGLLAFLGLEPQAA